MIGLPTAIGIAVAVFLIGAIFGAALAFIHANSLTQTMARRMGVEP